MNICMVTHDFPPQVGGIAAHVYELSRYLRKFSQNVVVLAPMPKEKESDFLNQNENEIFYVKENFNQAAKSLLLPLKLIDYSIRAHINLKRIIKKYSINIVHFHNLVPESIATKGLSVPVVFTAHESHLVNSHLKNKARLYFYLSHVDHLIAQNTDRLKIARKYCANLKSETLIPNGVDTNKFNISNQTGNLKGKYNISLKDRIIIVVSRLVDVKGVDYFVEAVPNIIKRFKDIKILIVGEGDRLPIIHKKINKLDVNDYIILTGSVENKLIPEYYSIADVVAIPSLDEGMSITGLEAMASGKPLIGTEVGGISALIEEGKNGFLVPPKNPQKLADAAIEMLKNPDLMIKMGKYSRKKAVEQFSWDKIAKETLKVYERCY